MPILTKAQLEALNQSSFPDNTTGAITPEILRTYNTATIETLVDSLDTGSFVQDLTSLNAYTTSNDEKWATVGTQSGSWGGGTTNTGSFATTGSNTFTGDQTIQSDGELNGIFYKTGSSEFFVGQRSNGNFSISSSAENRIIDINPSSGWVEHYTQTNFNAGVGLRGNTDVRNITQQSGNGYVATFDNFTASLQEGYAWVGKNGGTSISVPTSSFGGGGGTIVGYATTGSNTFTGSQYIDGGNKLYIQRDTAGAQQYLRLGATDNTYNFAFIVTGSDTNPGQQVWGINTAGGIWANSFDAGVVFNSYVTASNGIRIQDGGTFSAPLQQGYVWAGDSNGRTQAIPTSSFGGGGTIVGYATTGSNTFIGNQVITGSLGVTGEVSTDSRMYVFNQYGGIDIQQNAQGSGSQYPGMSMKVAPNTYPTDIYGGFTVLTEQGAIAGTTYLGMVANSYSPQYSGTTVPMIIANGNNPAGNDTAIIWKSDGTAEHWKKSDFKYGIDVTGSLNISGSTTITGSVKLTPASVSTNASYPITFVSGTTISKDSVDTLLYNPSTNTLNVSASTGNASISPNAITFISGSGVGTYSSALTKTAIVSTVETGYLIGISGNPSKLGAPSLANSTKPAIYASSGSGVPYVVMELQASQSFSDGRATFKRKLVGEQGFELTGSFTATIPTASAESQTNLFNFAPFVGANGTTYTSANISLQDYASSAIDQTFTVEYANADFQKYTGLVVGPTTAGSLAKFTLNTGTGYDFDEISLVDNGNNTSTALIKADTNRIVGTTQITGSLGVSSNLTIASGSGDLYVHGHKQFNVGAFQTNITQSGSAAVSQSVNFEITDLSYGVTIASNSRITIANAGVYSITFSAQFLADAGADTVYAWLKKNGTNVAETASKIVLANNTEQLMTVNFVVEAANNDYYEIAWQSTNGDAVLYAENASGNVPAIPSVILTVSQVR